MSSKLIIAVAVLTLSATGASGQNASGLPWQSGVTRPVAEFALWRGRALDMKIQFFGKLTWEHMRASANAVLPAGQRTSIGMAMVPDSHRTQLAQCSGGAFDVQITAIRDNMLRKGYRGSLIRLGWEANRVGGFPWAVQSDGSSWVGCFRRWVNIFNPPMGADRRRDFIFVWNMANVGTFPFPIDRMYPGNDAVDVIASQFYDRCPPITTEAEWTRRVTLRDQWGNPAGPQRWLEYARSKGKPYAIPEWGIGGNRTVCARPGIDNPFFVRKMHAFLRAAAPNIGFEGYFNNDEGNGSHRLYPADANPRAAAEYRRLW